MAALAALAALVSGSTGCKAPTLNTPPSTTARGFIAGVALGAYEHPPDPDRAASELDSIARLGATSIVLPVFWNATDVTSTRIEPFDHGVPQAAYDRSYIEIARRARARGMGFQLFPILRLERLREGEWRGTLRPEDWRAWWSAYRRFILHHASVAEECGAELFSVGSELGTTEAHRDEWARLIRDVRSRFTGPVIYSANWDHYEEVSFWDLVDGIGLSAYYELSERTDATQGELDAAWRGHRDRLLAWARAIGRPLYITEVGYPAQPGAAVRPWDYTASEPADPAAQARCYRAFAAAWQDVDLLRGVTLWIWNYGRGGPSDSGYAVAGKPAERVIRQFFQAKRGLTSRRR